MFRTTLCCAALCHGLAHRSQRSRACGLRRRRMPAAKPSPSTSCSSCASRPPARASPRPRPSYTQATAKAPRAPHRAIAARQKVSSGASGSRHIRRIAAGAGHPASRAMGAPYNPFDRPADAAPAETTGAAVASGPEVQLVDAEDINDIDRKADSDPPPCRAIRLAGRRLARRTASKPAFPGCGGSGLRSGAHSPRWQRRCTNSSAVIV